MKKIGFFACLGWLLFLVACAAVEPPSPPAEPAEPVVAAEPAEVELFNGQNLDGWDAFLSEPGVAKEDVWSVEDGILVCKGEPVGYLFTTSNYTSFKLRVEWRWAPGTEPGNSGVLMRVNGEPKPVPRAIEAQLKSGNAGDLYGFHGMKIDGDSARKKEQKAHKTLGDMTGVSKIQGNEVTPGEWNVYEIVLDGPSISVKVNGMLVNEAKDADVLAGPIALQSEGGVIHFRKVVMTPLD